MDLETLNKNIQLHERLDRAYEMAESLRQRAGLQAVSMDGMPHGSDVSDRVGSIAIAVADLMARIQTLEDLVEAGDNEVREFANSLEDERVQMAVQMRFIACMTWTQTSDALCLNSEDSAKRLVYRELGMDGIQLKIEYDSARERTEAHDSTRERTRSTGETLQNPTQA